VVCYPSILYSYSKLLPGNLRHSQGKGKDKFHPRTGYEDPEGEQSYSAKVSLTTAQDVGQWGVNATARSICPRKEPVPKI
jgi:hypothetical protein